ATASTGFTVKASATDSSGNTTEPNLFILAVTDDGAAAAPLAITAVPAGPRFLGGSLLALSASDSQASGGSVQVSVGGASLGSAPLSGARFALPYLPDGAPVSIAAQASTFDNGPVAASISGTLSRFASGPAASIALGTTDAAAALAIQGGSLLVARNDGGGRG